MFEVVIALATAIGCIMLGASILFAGLITLTVDVRVYLAMQRAILRRPPSRRQMASDAALASLGLMLATFGAVIVVVFMEAM